MQDSGCIQKMSFSGTSNDSLAAADASSSKITLSVASEDGDSVEKSVSLQAAKKSKMLSGLLEFSTDGASEAICLPNVTAETMERVIRFLEHMCESTAGEPAGDSVDLTEWERNFCNENDGHLLELADAADYLDCERLLDVVATRIAEECLNKTPDEIRQRFGIVNNLTPEQLEKIKEEMGWIDDDDDNDN